MQTFLLLLNTHTLSGKQHVVRCAVFLFCRIKRGRLMAVPLGLFFDIVQELCTTL